MENDYEKGENSIFFMTHEITLPPKYLLINAFNLNYTLLKNCAAKLLTN